MKKWRHIIRLAGKVLACCAVVAALGFVERSGGSIPVRDIVVDLQDAEGMHFIDRDALRQEVVEEAGPVIGTPIERVDEAAIEKRLRAIPCISDADVYHTVDGILHVKASQREPIVRVVNADGSGFYIDRDGWTMPLNANYTARVLVVTGQLNEPFSDRAPVNVAHSSDSLIMNSASRAIHAMARTLVQDPLWHALFAQAVVGADGDITLIPTVGMMRVRVGDGTRLAQRLEKLRTFFAEGIPQSDWRRYAAVDLRFDDQVVCTRRSTY